MSRIGKKPITLPSGVSAVYQERALEVKGPKGRNAFRVPPPVELKIDGGQIVVEADYQNDKRARCLMGTVRAVVQNMVTGVHQGFTRQLKLVGVGYRANLQGRKLELTLGFSRPRQYLLPEGVSAQVEANTSVILTSHDNVLLGQTAANIRALRPPEPYQGKGISYAEERIRRKAGKAGKK